MPERAGELSELWTRCREALVAHAQRVVGDRAEAEDVVDDVYLTGVSPDGSNFSTSNSYSPEEAEKALARYRHLMK